MFSSYLKITLRNILRHKAYSFINIAGLTMGMTCCIAIFLWVLDELSFNDFHQKIDNLYQVEQDQDYSGEKFHVNVTPHPMGPALLAEIPEVFDSTRYARLGGKLMTYQDKAFFDDGIRAVDPSFLRMLTFPLLYGDVETALDEPYSMVLTQKIARKYFATENPVGISFTLDNQYQFTVTGVIEAVPANSTLKFDMLVPYEFLTVDGRSIDSWANNSTTTLVQLNENSSLVEVGEKISALRARRVDENYRASDPDYQPDPERVRTEFSVRPLADLHLYGYFGYGTPMGNIRYVYIFSTIALAVLLIACINFMNLSTARSANRAREVGLRKVVGAVKGQIMTQFFGESVLFAFLALICSIVLVDLLMPVFNLVSGKELTLDIWNDRTLFLGLTGITLLTGVISGSYPALFLSSFQPVALLKGSIKASAGNTLFRRGLVVGQFILSVLLVIGTGTVFNQLSYMQNKDPGYDREQVLYIPLRGKMSESYETLKTALENNPHVVNISGTGFRPPIIGDSSSGAEWDGKDPELDVLISQARVDYNFVETMKIEMSSGRSFSRDFSTDSDSAFLINEELERIMGLEAAVNSRFSFMGIEGQIIGVMKDFHFQSVRYQIEPMAMMMGPGSMNFMLIRIPAQNVAESIDAINEVWESVLPAYPFDFTFIDEVLDEIYSSEAQMGTLLSYFSVFAVLIASLGLFGLASFSAEQRTREVGIRKILGATVFQVTAMLCKEFFAIVAIASLLACPIAWWLLRDWLATFAYRVEIDPMLFALAIVLAMLVTLITVSYQALRAALLNPVQSLRAE